MGSEEGSKRFSHWPKPCRDGWELRSRLDAALFIGRTPRDRGWKWVQVLSRAPSFDMLTVNTYVTLLQRPTLAQNCSSFCCFFLGVLNDDDDDGDSSFCD